MSSNDIENQLTAVNTELNNELANKLLIDNKNKVPQLNVQVNYFYNILYNELNNFLNNDLKDNNGNSYDNFLSYFSYKLYSEYGIKRKIHKYKEMDEAELLSEIEKKVFGQNKYLLIQFYYNKGLSSYDKYCPLTQLCRHMMFDFATFSIVSLGVTKSLDLENMMETLPSQNDLEEKYIVIEKFYEGSMLIYNPSLHKFNYNILNEDVDDENENVDKQIKNFEICTRRKVGTSYFNNPGKTFQEMFNENNTNQSINLDSLPSEFKQDYCFVFNIEHQENRIVSPNIINRNVLVAVYKLKDISINENILLNLLRNYTFNNFNEFIKLSQDAVIEINPLQINQILIEKYNMQFFTPQILYQLTINYTNLNTFIEQIMPSLSMYDVGYMIKDAYSGTHAKVRNPKYKELLDLKGYKPISLNEMNNKNLFRLWWDLRKDINKLNKFLSVFDIEGDNNINKYKKLFISYHRNVVNLTKSLFDTYQSAFVNKSMRKYDIDYIFKPLCGELHKLYMEKGKGIMMHDTIQFINNCKWYQIYWRIFDLNNYKNNNQQNNDE